MSAQRLVSPRSGVVVYCGAFSTGESNPRHPAASNRRGLVPFPASATIRQRQGRVCLRCVRRPPRDTAASVPGVGIVARMGLRPIPRWRVPGVGVQVHVQSRQHAGANR